MEVKCTRNTQTTKIIKRKKVLDLLKVLLVALWLMRIKYF